MANIRTIDYGGFNHATGSAATGSGFLIWSGSMSLSKSDAYANEKTEYYGVGIEAIADSASYLRFQTDIDGSGTSSLDIRTKKFILGSQGAGTSFISGSGDGTIAISSSNFELTEGGDVTMQGVITAEAGGTIGGWSVGTTALSSSNNSVLLDSNGPYYISASGFQVDGAGAITASAGKIASFNIEGDILYAGEDATSATQMVLAQKPGMYMQGTDNPIIKFQSQSTDYIKMFYTSPTDFGILGKAGGSNIFELGSTNQIAGWTFDSEKLTGGNITISSSGEIRTTNFISSMVGGLAGAGYKIGADGIAEFEEARIRGTLSTAVFEKETVSAVGGALIVANATAVKSGSMILSNLVNLNVHPTQEDDCTINSDTQVTFNSTAGLDRIKPITPQSGQHKMVSGRVYRAKATISSYAGSGTIGFSTDGGIDVSEGRRSSNGEIDTIFTYTSGQVHVFSNTGNSGVVSNVTIEEMSIPVDNTSGFVVGEYILAKATSSTGFTEEVMRVASLESASIDQLIVSRSMNGNLIQSMSAGQVVVSQGSNGTGFILLNATSGSETPYIDIVERDGTGIGDLSVKSRLGDLSGISDTINGVAVSGFGLYTDNAFLKGGIAATFGTIGGFGINATTISSSNDNLILRNTGEITGSQVKFTGGKVGAWTIDATGLETTAQLNGLRLQGGTTDYSISSSNFKVTPTGNVTASNLFLSGSARAVSFSEKLVTIGSGNKSLYFQNYSSGGDSFTRIILDGSLGGEQTMNIQLDVDTDHPIGDFKFTDQGTGFKQECTVTINVAGVTFNDGQIAPTYAEMSK